jgi:hypothetical protein
VTYADWRARFLEAIDEGLYPAAWLDWLLETENAKFWGNDRAAIIAEMREYPSGAREVHGLVAAGEIDGIKALIPLAEEWGRSLGATRAAISSHPAWARIMRADGYEPNQLSIVKVL